MIGMVKSIGKEHVPDQGPVLLVANHAYRVLDPVILSMSIPRKCKFVAHKDIVDSVFLGSFIPKNMIIPIDDSPNAIQESVNQCKLALKEGHAIVFFPEGRSMGNGHGQYRTGAAYVAAKAQCPIVPVRIQRTVFFRHKVVFGKAHAPPKSKDRATLSKHTQLLKEHILNL
jgi:1-acyl-sn-glycerol-3-phosphate acyltransferase